MEDLPDQGLRLRRRSIAKLMKISGLAAIELKSFKPRTARSEHTLGYDENPIMALKAMTCANRPRVGDITYISIRELGFGVDGCVDGSVYKKAGGWKLGVDMTEQIVIDSLKMPIMNRKPKPGMIHHSDRGGQIAGRTYRKIVSRAGTRQSMSRTGECHDKAFMESCFGTIATEPEMTEYETDTETLADIKDYISYYNFDRKHSALDYQKPACTKQKFNLGQETE